MSTQHCGKNQLNEKTSFCGVDMNLSTFFVWCNNELIQFILLLWKSEFHDGDKFYIFKVCTGFENLYTL